MKLPSYPQVGVGWAFPVRWEVSEDGAGGESARVVRSQDERRVAEALRLILRTIPGSRAMRPTFGAGVDRYVFDPRTEEVCFRLAADVRRALVRWEPRVLVDRVEAVPAGEGEDRIDVSIDYRIDAHRRPSNLVVTFDLEGGEP